jgi:hypothetical protein
MMKPLIFFLAGILFSAYLHAQLPAYLPADGLVGWWPFNGNANDESGNGNDGVVNGAVLTGDRFGTEHSAFSFDGVSSRINLLSPILFLDNSFTINLYCLAFEFGASTNEGYSYIFGSPLAGGTNDQGFRFGTNSTLNTFTATIGDFSINDYYLIGNIQNFNQEWQQLTMVLNRENFTFSFYINSNLVQSVAVSSNFGTTDSGQLPTIGALHSDNGTFHLFNGLIDDISIYNRALSPQEITALYTGIPAGNGGGSGTASTNLPAAISYQAVARDAHGQPLSNSNLQLRFTLLADSLNGASEYVETHALTTNALGLFTTAFGSGTPVTNTFAAINWASGNKYLKVELDAGAGYVDMGTQQLLSVPFALRSQSAGEIENNALPIFPNNAAAIAGGLNAGKMYRTATGDLKVVY